MVSSLCPNVRERRCNRRRPHLRTSAGASEAVTQPSVEHQKGSALPRTNRDPPSTAANIAIASVHRDHLARTPTQIRCTSDSIFLSGRVTSEDAPLALSRRTGLYGKDTPVDASKQVHPEMCDGPGTIDGCFDLKSLLVFYCFLRFAQYCLMRSACASRWALVNFRRPRFGPDAFTEAEATFDCLGGRPRRPRAGNPCSAAIAALSLSRSVIRSWRISSVVIWCGPKGNRITAPDRAGSSEPTPVLNRQPTTPPRAR